MKPLNVPLVRQEKNSVLCGVASIRMLLAYHGIEANQEAILKEVKIHKGWGTFTPQWGIFLMNHGFKVEIITQNPKLFTAKDRGKKKAVLLKVLEERLGIADSKTDIAAIKEYITYLKQGGVLTVKIPDVRDIQEEIRSKRPLLAELTSNWLLGLRRNVNFHFNVITGIDAKYAYVNDPLWHSAGGKKRYPIADYLFALHASSYGSPDEGCLMKVIPNSRPS
ncbi:MAG: C39 family peptidase [Patescibacteria group bacterium]